MVPESEEIDNAQQSVWNGVDAQWAHTECMSGWVACSWEIAGGRADLLPNGKLLREKIVFLKLVSEAKGEFKWCQKLVTVVLP